MQIHTIHRFVDLHKPHFMDKSFLLPPVLYGFTSYVMLIDPLWKLDDIVNNAGF